MRITLDEQQDKATIRLSEERQSREHGGTYLLVAHGEDDPTPNPDAVTVQLGFEGNERLLWISVTPASKALPSELLAQAERV